MSNEIAKARFHATSWFTLCAGSYEKRQAKSHREADRKNDTRVREAKKV